MAAIHPSIWGVASRPQVIYILVLLGMVAVSYMQYRREKVRLKRGIHNDLTRKLQPVLYAAFDDSTSARAPRATAAAAADPSPRSRTRSRAACSSSTRSAAGRSTASWGSR